jgi:hypothetical protein
VIVAVALLRCRAVRGSLPISRCLAIRCSAVGIVVRLLDNHGRRCRRRLLAAGHHDHGCAGK